MTPKDLLASMLPSLPTMPVLPATTTFYQTSKTGLVTPNQPIHIATLVAEQESKPKASVTILSEYCKGCELCVRACPTGNLSLSQQLNRKGYHPAVFDFEGARGQCSACGICYWVCPDMAITKIGRLGP